MLEYLENTGLAVWVRESPSLFAYTGVLTVHAIGLAIVVGVSTLIALRLLGFGKDIPLAALGRLYGAIWFGFTINAISGALLFIAEGQKMAAMVAFWAKLAFIAAGMVIGQMIRSGFLADEQSVKSGVVTPGARKLAYMSLACWYLALIVGRLTGYPDLVADWFHLQYDPTIH